MTIGELIKKYREDNDISQRRFAEISGLTNGYISMLESGVNPSTGEPIAPSVKSLKSIADAMGISFDKLLALDDFNVDLSEDELATISSDELGVYVLRLIRNLSPENQRAAVQYIRYLATREDSGTVPPVTPEA